MTKPGKDKLMSFDGMVKFFLQYYRIPSKKDFDKLMDRIDKMEKLIKSKVAEAGKLRSRAGRKKAGQDSRPGMTASGLVLEVIQAAGKKGVGISEIKEKTGFEDKKLRNIIFRLNKLGRISRKSRGIYTA